MRFIMSIANFYFGVKNTGRFFKEKNPVYLYAGLMFAAASGIYFYLAEKDGEIEIKFGDDPALWEEE